MEGWDLRIYRNNNNVGVPGFISSGAPRKLGPTWRDGCKSAWDPDADRHAISLISNEAQGARPEAGSQRAAWQAERGAPESVLQDRLGHSKGSTVTRAFYVQTTDEARRSAVIELPLGAGALKSDQAESALSASEGGKIVAAEA